MVDIIYICDNYTISYVYEYYTIWILCHMNITSYDIISILSYMHIYNQSRTWMLIYSHRKKKKKYVTNKNGDKTDETFNHGDTALKDWGSPSRIKVQHGLIVMKWRYQGRYSIIFSALFFVTHFHTKLLG